MTAQAILTSDAPFHAGVVPYLNVAPIEEGLRRAGGEALRLTPCRPSELAARFDAGEFDAGITPVAHPLRRGDLWIAPVAALGCDGPVESVLLVSKVPFGRVKSLLTDRSSLTSALLSRVILRDSYGVTPDVEPSPAPLRANHDFQGDPHDAFTIIGDEALRLPPVALPHRLDLGEAWKRLTGLPFVFAVWALREADSRAAAFARLLENALRWGMDNMDEVCESASRRLGLPLGRVREYLARHMVYDFGAPQRQGIEEFARRLAPGGWITPHTPALRYLPLDSPTTTSKL